MSGQACENRVDRFFLYSAKNINSMGRVNIICNAFISLVLVASFSGCRENTGVDNVTPYEGPLLEVSNMQTLYSDSAIVKVKVQAKKQLEFENGDREFPEGIYIEFYDVNGKISSTLKADKGYFDKKEKLYTGIGDVEVNSYEKDEKLNTEELHWKQDKEEIYTDKFVRIETADEILLGEGLTASQDFSNYKILKPTGELSISQE